jgi:hypothetical protein
MPRKQEILRKSASVFPRANLPENITSIIKFIALRVAVIDVAGWVVWEAITAI